MASSLKYRFDHLIQKGGFGSVFAATRVEDSSPVAVKLIPEARVSAYEEPLLDGEDGRRRIPLEIVLLKKVGHVPGVVRLLDHYYDARNGLFGIVMERPTNMIDLFEFDVQNGPRLDESVARILFRRVVTALLGCHRAGVLHRDVKEENVLVDPDTLEIRLVDFGSATHLVADPAHNYYQDNDGRKFTGTKVMYPPEFFTRGFYGGVEATVWSLGILLFVMVCGDLPFENENEIVRAEIRFPPPSDGDDGVLRPTRGCRELIGRCLCCVRERPSLEEILRDPWLSV